MSPLRSASVLFAFLLAAPSLLAAQQKPSSKDAPAASKEAQETLAAAKARLGTGWDYLVQPDCVVLFDFDVKHLDQKPKTLANAKAGAVELSLLLAHFRADVPPHPDFPKTVPILRVFRDEAGEKAFLGADTTQKWLTRQTEQIASNEITGRHGEVAWQWYFRQFIGDELIPERWFRTLCSARYSRLHASGKQLEYDAPDLTKKSGQIASVTLDEALVAMNTTDHIDSFLAALADLLERGPKLLGKDFDPSWGKIVSIYCTELRVRSKDQARKQAFAEVDMAKLEKAVKDWASKKR